MKEKIMPISMGLLVLMLIFLCSSILSESRNKDKEISNLNVRIIRLQNEKNGDSVLLSEYQSALDSLIHSNPEVAHEFIRYIENINTKNDNSTTNTDN